MIKDRIAAMNIPISDRYQKSNIDYKKRNVERLTDLYDTLLDKKYNEVLADEKVKAAKDLEKEVRRITRDDPNFIR